MFIGDYMFISPMLLHYANNNEPYNGSRYISELKLDGIRLIVSNMDQLKLYTRHHNDVTAKFTELHDSPIAKGTVLDGELIVTAPDGSPDFEAVMSRFHSNRSKHKVTFVAFDILYYNGIDVMGLPLMRRKELLNNAFIETDYYKKSRWNERNNIEFFDICKLNKLEGIVIKDRDSNYEKNTRSWSWQKVVSYVENEEVVITGYWKDKFGWLIGKEENGRIKPVGTLELGVGSVERKAVYPILNKLKTAESKHHVYVEPRIRCKVKYRHWTKAGMMRLPVFQEFIL